jgi:hypothetical protein
LHKRIVRVNLTPAGSIEIALTADVRASAAAVQVAAVEEAGRQADALLGEPPVPGSIE